MTDLATTSQNFCTHCGNALTAESTLRIDAVSPAFCCAGCETVYAILSSRGLGRYYEIKEACELIRKPRPVRVSHESFAYLDDPEFQKLYLMPSLEDGRKTVELYLEGVHCVACLWLVEKLPELVSGVESAQLDIGRSIARLTLTPDAKLAPIAAELDRLGYRPHIIRHDEEAAALLKRENRTWLTRIGVAATCAGNIMLMAVPLYAGADGYAGQLFRWVSLALFVPTLFYSSVPFFRSAWSSLRTRSISIDVPIVLAIVFGGIISAINVVRGSEHIYFDSLSALVFLLLSSRYVLRRIQQSALGSSHLLNFLAPSRARRFDPELRELKEVPVHTLKADDVIEVQTGEIFPADGLVATPGGGFVSNALLTGEAVPTPVREDDLVYSGTENQGEPLQIKITATGLQTRIGEILRQAEEASRTKARIVDVTDRASRWFLAGVVISAILLFVVVYSYTGVDEALNRALALMIVTCPCALALATPLALSISLSRAARAGILIKSANALEKLSTVKTVFLDKTGTLTEGRFDVLDWRDIPELRNPNDRLAAWALERQSRHPIAKALVRHLGSEARKPALCPEISDFQETLGLGVSGTVFGHHYGLKTLPQRDGFSSPLATYIGLYRDGSLIACITLGDRMRSDSVPALNRIRSLGLEPIVLSGDNQTVVNEVASRLAIAKERAFSEFSPEQKREAVAGRKDCLMVGDGANDAVALSAAYVSAAVHGSVELSLRTADIYVASPGVSTLAHLLEMSKETMRTIHRNLIFSLFYNLLGAIGAIFGWMNPLFAAILMPLSALTVFLSSKWGTSALRQVFSELTT